MQKKGREVKQYTNTVIFACVSAGSIGASGEGYWLAGMDIGVGVFSLSIPLYSLKFIPCERVTPSVHNFKK